MVISVHLHHDLHTPFPSPSSPSSRPLPPPPPPLSFARLTGLDVEDSKLTLNLFGDYYRKDVLGNPDGDDHGNIRALLKGDWAVVKFPNGLCLTPKEGTFGIDADVGEMLDAASTIGAGDDWDPDSDIWIP